MKISAYAVRPAAFPNLDPGWRFGGQRVPSLKGVFLALRAEDSTQGEGYVPVLRHLGSSAEGLAAALAEMGQALLGRPALHVAANLAVAAKARPGDLPALSAVDCALHDLAARLYGVSVATLLGGARRRRLPVLRIVPIKSPEDMTRRAAELAGEGFKALKLKLEGDLDEDIARVAAVRQELGGAVTLYVDPNQAYRAKPAIALCQALADLGVERVEQPVLQRDYRQMAAVTAATPLIVEADEGLHTSGDLLALAGHKAADAICLKLTKSGGIRAVVSMAEMSGPLGLDYRMSTAFGGALISLAAAQAAAVLPAAPGFAEVGEFAHFGDDPHAPPRVVEGALELDDAPGMGLERQLSELRWQEA